MATGWLGPAAGIGGLWLFAALMLTPTVASTQLRALLSRWPIDRLWLNYPLLVGLAVTGSLGGVVLVQWTLAVAVGYPLVVAVLGPQVADWSPAATDGIDGRVVVVLTAICYGATTAVVAGLVFLGLMASSFPG